MRLVRVKTPEGQGEQVARLAFEAGVPRVTTHQQQSLKADGEKSVRDVVDVETATPTAKAFVDAVMSAPFFDPEEYTIAVRQPRSIVSGEGPRRLTRPLVEPTADIFEELWQFSHVTYGFVGRILIASLLLAYGIIESKLLIIIAGLLFMPLLPLMLAMGFGLCTRQWRLAGQGLFALLVALALAVAGGAAVALVCDPPLKYGEANPLLVSFLISLAVGVAGGLATGDDVGRREMIGLAATAQIAIIPVWLGVTAVFGVSPLESSGPAQRATALLMNIATIIVASAITYAILGMRGRALSLFAKGSG